MKLFIWMLLFVSCSRERDQFADSFAVSSTPVKKSSLKCYSGGSMYFFMETEKRIWIGDGGQFETVDESGLTTVTGDCILVETY